MKRVRVRLPGRAYPILIGPGQLSRLGALIDTHVPGSRGRDLLVIADSRVNALHGATLLRGLEERFRVARALVPPGEGSKTLARTGRLYEACRRHALGRDGVIVAFGGGVVGDLAGFVAATWLRGVDLVMVPTTLLAQVDSSIGGKVGVNLDGVKNMVGSFHQPRLVVSDTSLLATLPVRERRSAFAEIVKCGMIADARLLGLLEREADAALAGDPRILEKLVAACCRIKARIVAADERERGAREVLNYGHTIGHAIEAAAAGRLRHGEAVALGMRAAARLSEELGHLPPAGRERQDRLLDRLGLPAVARGLDAGLVFSKLKWDKKVRGRNPRFVLTGKVGSATLALPVEEARVRRALDALLV
jgi:3-dehydroquinate synthase